MRLTMPVVMTAEEVSLASCSPASTPLAICTFPAQSIELDPDNIDREAIVDLPTEAHNRDGDRFDEFLKSVGIKAKFC